jgi:hypothetical protein
MQLMPWFLVKWLNINLNKSVGLAESDVANRPNAFIKWRELARQGGFSIASFNA